VLRTAFAMLILLTTSVPVWAETAEEVLSLWASQPGMWVGDIVIYGPAGTEPRTVGLTTTWNATPDKRVPVKIETFSTPDGEFSSVTLMLADPESDGIVTPYFSNGKQRDYRFSVLEVTQSDDTHWTTVIASPDGQEVYEGRPAILRYIRTRGGNLIENTKEVNFLDDDGDETYELRSFIRQSLVSAQ
jgi:hypothetical protein